MTSEELGPESIDDLAAAAAEGSDYVPVEDPDAAEAVRHAAAGADRQARRTSPQAKVAQVAVGTVLIAGDQVKDGVRTVGGRTAAMLIGLLAKTKDQTDRARERIGGVVDDAERRGRDTLAARKDGAATLANSLVSTTVDDAMAWAQVKVMPQFIDDLVPHLISDVMPRLIDGALPEIRDRVVPVIIGDLTTDARVQELILAQSRGVLGQIAEQLRTTTVRADDRMEATAQRVVGRDKTARSTTGTAAGVATTGPAVGATGKGLNEIRSV